MYWSDPYGLFQFAKRPLGGSGISGPESGGNLGVYHENGFYQDGSGDNVGFFPDGPIPDPNYPANADQYTYYPKYYDDDLMRKAQAWVDSGEYDFISNNCQDYADKLRDAYDRLSREDPFHPYNTPDSNNNLPLP